MGGGTGEIMIQSRLNRDFFARPTPIVAKDLIGRGLFALGRMGFITETEAYTGFDDPASHAFRGPTPRCQIMFQNPGYTYVYLIYGMYFCLNIVTEQNEIPGAVLIRGIWNKTGHYDGPGKLCRYFGITRDHHGIDLMGQDDLFIFESSHKRPSPDCIHQTPRIGIKNGLDKLWRYWLVPHRIQDWDDVIGR